MSEYCQACNMYMHPHSLSKHLNSKRHKGSIQNENILHYIKAADMNLKDLALLSSIQKFDEKDMIKNVRLSRALQVMQNVPSSHKQKEACIKAGVSVGTYRSICKEYALGSIYRYDNLPQRKRNTKPIVNEQPVGQEQQV